MSAARRQARKKWRDANPAYGNQWARSNVDSRRRTTDKYEKKIASLPKPGEDTIKRCVGCGEEKQRKEFYTSKRAPDGRIGRCRACSLARQRFKKYGLTTEQRATIFDAQKGACAICTMPLGRFVVDHNHKTGQVRGFLCQPCNLAIGHMRDDANLCIAAARYLRDDGNE